MNHMWRTALLALLLQQSSVGIADEPQQTAAAATATLNTPTTTVTLPLEDLRNFVEIFERIRTSYVDPVDDKTLFENAIRGMLSALDPHSAYLNQRDYEDLKELTTGEFGGIGVELGVEDGMLRIISPIDDTPASRAGIQAGDYIIKLEDKLVRGLTIDQAIDLMRGSIGQPLRMTIQRKGKEPQELTLIRAKIELSSVKSRELESGFYAIRISQFQNHTGRDLNKVLTQLKEQKTPPKGIVLDLRNNPGGVLPGAIEVADAFLDKGLVVYTKGRADDSMQNFESNDGQTIPNIPLIVLVNGASASASEIVAGALQDRHRALIVGTTTFGKGSVQTVLPVSENKAIKLTTARYYTPSGRSIQAEGIKPDVVVQPAKYQALASNENSGYKEANLRGHLANPQEDKDTATTDKASETAERAKTATEVLTAPSSTTTSEKKSSRKGAKAPTIPTDVAKPTSPVAPESKADEKKAVEAENSSDNKVPLAEDDYMMYEALNLLKSALFWQQANTTTSTPVVESDNKH